MSRPPKCRRVDSIPDVTYFKPAGIPLRELQEVCLTVEEVEAIRLKDLEGMEQQAGAEKMNISRPTFQRVLSSARQKIADGLLNGKAIRIEGGNFEMSPRRFRCANSHEWEVPFESTANQPPELCPTCSTLDIAPLQPSGLGCGTSKHGRRRQGARRCNGG
ncbi:MAG: DUF134 domain-containing protein [Dehalococcoidia bacterium]|nr:DUF134 domain-containing protein [Dehalococcoidia bacterium]